jgi:hypothetical protein
MNARSPLPTGPRAREEREATLRAFILGEIEAASGERPDAIAVLAFSPESPVTRAVLSLSGDLAARGMGATIILTGGAAATANETWDLVFSSSFTHEIRLTTNPRVLDGHEQLIIGDRAVWFGDCMRRDPEKRDAFEKFVTGEPRETQAARLTFARLWQNAQPIYANAQVAAVTVGPASSADEAPASALPPNVATMGTTSGKDILETLEAWQPATRH